MRKSILAIVLASFAALFAAPAAHAWQDEQMKDVELKYGNVITHFKASEWLAGTEVKKLDKNKVYVVDLWSSAAPGCKRSIPMMHELNEEYASKGLQVVGFTVDKEDVAKDFMKDKAAIMNYPIGLMKDGGGGQSDLWRKIARAGALPVAAVINRAGQVCFVGSPFDDSFMRILKRALDDRFDTELISQAEPILGAARRAAKLRNFREANRLYDQVVDLKPRHFGDVALEQWRMIAEQANDAAGAKAFVRKYIDRLGDDIPSLVVVGQYLATSTEMKHRDLDAAKYVAEKLAAKRSTDPDALACIAAVQAANGDFTTAAETQYDAWLAAAPSSKAAFKRALDQYRKGQVAPPADGAAIGAPTTEPAKTDPAKKDPAKPEAPKGDAPKSGGQPK